MAAGSGHHGRGSDPGRVGRSSTQLVGGGEGSTCSVSCVRRFVVLC